MKHLSTTPTPPSRGAPGRAARARPRRHARAREGPGRALPDAEEMDADLARVARGLGVSRPETEDGDAGDRGAEHDADDDLERADARCRGAAGRAAGLLRLRGGAAAPLDLAVAAARSCSCSRPSSAASSSTTQIQDQLERGRAGLGAERRRARARRSRSSSSRRGLQYEIERGPSDGAAERLRLRPEPGRAASASPEDATRHARTSRPGRRRRRCRTCVGRSRDRRGRGAHGREAEADTSTGQLERAAGHGDRAGPEAGRRGREGTTVRINVSQGRSRSASRRASGSRTSRRPRSSRAPASRSRGATPTRTSREGTVIDQDPPAARSAPKGATVTLTVSKGPHDGRRSRRDRARPATRRVATLEDSGFEANVAQEDTADPTLDGLVLSQDPAGGAQARAGSPVTIVVGRFAPRPWTTTDATDARRRRRPGP